MDRPDAAEQPGSGATDETSMRWLEYGVCALAVIAAVLLGFLR